MKTVLIVEDEELLSQVFGDTLKKTGYSVLIANDGATALNYFKEKNPDLVILDIKLPDMSGLKILDEIRKKSSDLPVIMCTAYDSFRSDYQSWSSRVSDYVVKPIVLDDLKEKVKKLLGDAA